MEISECLIYTNKWYISVCFVIKQFPIRIQMTQNCSYDHYGAKFVDFDVLGICIMEKNIYFVFQSSDLDDYLSKFYKILFNIY